MLGNGVFIKKRVGRGVGGFVISKKITNFPSLTLLDVYVQTHSTLDAVIM